MDAPLHEGRTEELVARVMNDELLEQLVKVVQVKEVSETARDESNSQGGDPQLLKCVKQKTAGKEQMIENSFLRDTEENMKVVGSSEEKYHACRGAALPVRRCTHAAQQESPEREGWHGRDRVQCATKRYITYLFSFLN